MKLYLLLTLCLVLTVTWGAIGSALGREITDMAGRKVTVPGTIKTAHAPSPYGFAILHTVAPETLAGLMFPLKDEDKQYLQRTAPSKKIMNRPGGEREGNMVWKEINPPTT